MSRRTKLPPQKGDAPNLGQSGHQEQQKEQAKATGRKFSRAGTDSRSRVAADIAAKEVKAKVLPLKLVRTTTRAARQLQQILRDSPGNSSEVQRQRIRQALKVRGGVTTPELRQHLDIHSPASRVGELRREGSNIITVMVLQETMPNCRHRFAQYRIAPGGSM
ncbi:helix-turn-helix domain-containing protein [Paucibacter sp. TC2R-5]|uniref:helix-turn-helix domain-containing protein n=1 Tax=Paucibacter sp. TC2R-5 TaxID=2893555 RepID=UPI0021E4564F|nr:helix-turn-helix domain-containing protein [Paucibacter sp. TC2R-5]MCV2361437.1 helix-turn-helix domain-containing protein [Paucibacter sp. TC2R-5]